MSALDVRVTPSITPTGATVPNGAKRTHGAGALVPLGSRRGQGGRGRSTSRGVAGFMTDVAVMRMATHGRDFVSVAGDPAAFRLGLRPMSGRRPGSPRGGECSASVEAAACRGTGLVAKPNLLAFVLAVAACLLCAIVPARADYPERAVRLIVPYPAGGSSDIVGRLFAERLEKELGRPVVVENVGGGGGALGAQKVSTAPADGHTLLVGSGSELLIRGLLQPTPYEVTKDFAPITLIGTGPMVIVAKLGLPAQKLEDLLSLARGRPGKLSYGSAGQGTFMHILGEAFKAKARLEITHVPYRGAAPMMADVMGGHIDLGVASLASALPSIERGQVRGYAVTSRGRVEFAPDIPALSEIAELSGLELELWIGLFAPRGLPAAVASRLETASAKVIGAADFRAKLAEQALIARSLTGEGFRGYLSKERDKYRSIVEGSGISPP